MVTLSRVTKSYMGENRILDQVNLSLNKGDFLYVVGDSGAGKSSLLRMLATEEPPTSGSVSLFGYNLAQVSPSTLRSIRQSLGYIPQDIRLLSDFSVWDNVMLSLKLARKGLETKLIEEILEALGLITRKADLVRDLSGGEAQRVAIARALVRRPELIVADEPTGAQDRNHTWAAVDLIARANMKGTTVVMATHDREIVRRVRKRCALLKHGQVVMDDNLCFY